MRVLVQRCENASVVVDEKIVGTCQNGLMIFVGFTENDSLKEMEYLAKKVINLRIFPDENNVMNKSILDVGGTILSVSQFTLYADTTKGNRPSYIKALNGTEAKKLYEKWNEVLSKYVPVETGIFGANMKVNFTNVGPTTIWLEKCQ